MALVDSENAAPAPPSAAAGVVARIKAILAERSDSRLAQLVAGKVFLVRVASALLALVSQVLLARWMGSFEFGIYIYVWTWVLMIGALSDIGLSSAARRFIPEYTELKSLDRLRGFLTGSRWLAFGVATAIGALGAVGVTVLAPWLDQFAVVPLYLACAHHSDLRPGAGAGRHRAILQLAESRADAVLHLASAHHHRADGRGLSVRRADRRGDRDDRRRRHHLGGDHRPVGRARPPPQANGAGRPEAVRGQDLARHLAADLRGGSLLPAADLRGHSRARAVPLARRSGGLLCRRAAAWRSSPSSISPSPAPPRTSSPNITWPATKSGSPRSLPRPSGGRSGPRSRPAR